MKFMRSGRLSWLKLRCVLALVVAGLLPMFQVPGATGVVAAAGVPSGATLTILTGLVEIASSSGAAFAPATQGQLVVPGAVIRTDSDGVAVLTFFDGSESQVAPASQVEVRQADYTPAPHIELFQSQGVTVNRVIPLPPDGSFRTDTPDAIGLVRGTSFVVTVGSASAAERATSVVLLRDRDGHVGQVNVMPVATGLASEHPAVLARAGAVAVTAELSTASGKLSAAALAELEQAAHDLHEVSTAQSAAAQARDVLQTIAPAVQPLAAPVPHAPATVASVEQVQHETVLAAHSTHASGQVEGTDSVAVLRQSLADAPASTGAPVAVPSGSVTAVSPAGLGGNTESSASGGLASGKGQSVAKAGNGQSAANADNSQSAANEGNRQSAADAGNGQSAASNGNSTGGNAVTASHGVASTNANNGGANTGNGTVKGKNGLSD